MKPTHSVGVRRNRVLARMYAVLDRPWVYRLARLIFAPGAIRAMDAHVRRLVARLPSTDAVLDVGCGPTSPLFSAGLRPVGVDVAPSYIRAYTKHGAPGVLGSADALPFATNCFGGVWASGMVHHVPDDVAMECMREMIRVAGRRVTSSCSRPPSLIHQRGGRLPIGCAGWIEAASSTHRSNSRNSCPSEISGPWNARRTRLRGLRCSRAFTGNE